MNCCGGNGVSVWKDSQWVCSDCGTIKSNDPDYLYGSERYGLPSYIKPPKGKVCECGAEKTYGPGASHTMYCPKHEGVK